MYSLLAEVMGACLLYGCLTTVYLPRFMIINDIDLQAEEINLYLIIFANFAGLNSMTSKTFMIMKMA